MTLYYFKKNKNHDQKENKIRWTKFVINDNYSMDKKTSKSFVFGESESFLIIGY